MNPPSSLCVIDMEPDQSRVLAAAARDVEPGPSAGGGALAEAGAAAVAALPPAVLRALHQLGAGQAGDVLVIRGLTQIEGLEPTPATAEPGRLAATARACQVMLLAVLTPLGAPFTFASLYGGRLVQHVVPVRGREDAQTSEGSGTLLAAHVEDAFTEQRCDWFGLLCLRGAADAATVLARSRDLRLPAATMAVLRQPRFVIEPDLAHGAAPAPKAARPVITGPADDPEIRYDAVYQTAAAGDTAAAAALAELRTELERVSMSWTLAAGDLLLVDNRRVVHGRTRFAARFDGSDRWLMRAMACADRRGHRAAGAPRTVEAVAR